jgi:type IV fimbrial biogenesis protein FimT
MASSSTGVSAMPADARRTRGFTLIELLMSVAILAVLLTLAAPAYGRLTGRTKAQAAQQQLGTALNQARLAAVARAAHVIACPSADGERCDRTTQWHHGWLVFADLDHDGARSATEPVIAVTQAQPAGVAIVGTTGRLRVDYKPDGYASGTNLTLTICDRMAGVAAATTLVVNQAGRVRSGKPGADAAAACVRVAGG